MAEALKLPPGFELDAPPEGFKLDEPVSERIPASIEPEKDMTVGELGHMAAKGALWNLSDEALGLAKAAPTFLTQGLQAAKEKYRTEQQAEQALQEDIAKRHPGKSLLAELGGGLVTGGLAGGAVKTLGRAGLSAYAPKLLSSIRTLGPAAKAAVVGGAEGAGLGAIAGAGASKSDLGTGEFAKDVIGSSALGGGFGTVAGGLLGRIQGKKLAQAQSSEEAIQILQNEQNKANSKVQSIIDQAKKAGRELSKEEENLIAKYQDTIQATRDNIQQQQAKIQQDALNRVQEHAPGLDEHLNMKSAEEAANQSLRDEAVLAAQTEQEQLGKALSTETTVPIHKAVETKSKELADDIINARSTLAKQYGEPLEQSKATFNLNNIIKESTDRDILQHPKVQSLLKEYKNAGYTIENAPAPLLDAFRRDLRDLMQSDISHLLKDQISKVLSNVTDKTSAIRQGSPALKTFSENTIDKLAGSPFYELGGNKKATEALREGIKNHLYKANSSATTPDANASRAVLKDVTDYLAAQPQEVIESGLNQKALGKYQDLNDIIKQQLQIGEMSKEASRKGIAPVVEKNLLKTLKTIPEPKPQEQMVEEVLQEYMAKTGVPPELTPESYKEALRAVLMKQPPTVELAPSVQQGLLSTAGEQVYPGLKGNLVTEGVGQSLEGPLTPRLQEAIQQASEKTAAEGLQVPEGVSNKLYTDMVEYLKNNPDVSSETRNKLYNQFLQSVQQERQAVAPIGMTEALDLASHIPGSIGKAARVGKWVGKAASATGNTAENLLLGSVGKLSQLMERNPATAHLVTTYNQAVQDKDVTKQNQILFSAMQSNQELREALKTETK